MFTYSFYVSTRLVTTMADVLTKEQRSKCMSNIRGKNTKPELLLRRALWKKGYRYRLHYGIHNIDIAFPGKKVAVFVDGCFWHKCPKHFVEPKSNRDFWISKIQKNVQRDKKVARILQKEEWKVIRIWEHELKQNPTHALNKIERAFGKF